MILFKEFSFLRISTQQVAIADKFCLDLSQLSFPNAREEVGGKWGILLRTKCYGNIAWKFITTSRFESLKISFCTLVNT